MFVIINKRIVMTGENTEMFEFCTETEMKEEQQIEMSTDQIIKSLDKDSPCVSSERCMFLHDATGKETRDAQKTWERTGFSRFLARHCH